VNLDLHTYFRTRTSLLIMFRWLSFMYIAIFSFHLVSAQFFLIHTTGISVFLMWNQLAGDDRPVSS
jgi:hypothetical protein